MLCCRECSLGFHLNLSNAELAQCFFDARCGISEMSQREQSVGLETRALLNMQQFTQCLVFAVRLLIMRTRMSITPLRFAGGTCRSDLPVRLEGKCSSTSSPAPASLALRQLPPQGNWCPPSVCQGLRSVFAACTEIKAFAKCDGVLSVPVAVAVPPPHTANKLEKRPTMSEKRMAVAARVEDAPPPAPALLHPSAATGTQRVDPLLSPNASAHGHQRERPPRAVPPLNLSKVSSWNDQSAQASAHSPSATTVCLLPSHRALPPSVFMQPSSHKAGVSFCMPRGMNKQFSCRRVELQVPAPPKEHPIATSRRPARHVEK